MWEKKPVLLLILATASILVGTIITMAMPFLWINTAEDRIEGITPYTALELEGRDVYIREGCNNCHTQTIRPLEADVKRYGAYSRSGEFIYDRPHLWGSRRMGPDLARIGGKYPDEWHVNHLISPTSMVPESNMPAYAFLADAPLDAKLAKRKMETLGFPYTDEELLVLANNTEMDAMVAYLQKLGIDLPDEMRTAGRFLLTREADSNPLADDEGAADRGAGVYLHHCSGCHMADRSGDIGPGLDPGYDDADLFDTVAEGIEGSMPGFSDLGRTRIWELVSFINREE